MITKQKFAIGSIVYHCTPESGAGIVVDACFFVLGNFWKYQVTFYNDQDETWYYEHELRTGKVFGMN